MSRDRPFPFRSGGRALERGTHLEGEGLPPDGGVAQARKELADVLVLFRSSRGALARNVEALEAGDPVKAGAAVAATGDLRKWAQALHEELGRVERSLREGSDEPWDGELDLGRARDTIGRRLDRLRAAGDPGGLPE